MLRNALAPGPYVLSAAVWLIASVLPMVGGVAVAQPASPHPTDAILPFDGPWEFRVDGETDWKRAEVPSTFESIEGAKFDGIGWYRTRIRRVDVPVGQEWVVRFEGAATEAKVWCDGTLVGEHLGGWTPFECPITEHIRLGASAGGDGNEPANPQDATSVQLLVRIDERVGHNSQGFLPVFAPHFGGLWKPVTLLRRPTLHIDGDALFAWGDPTTSQLHLEIPLRGGHPTSLVSEDREWALAVDYRLRNAKQEFDSSWTEAVRRPIADQELDALQGEGQVSIALSHRISNPALWSPASPALYDVRIRWITKKRGGDSHGEMVHEATTHCGFRKLETRGDQLLLNGEPIQVRGILNWGYAPPSTAPSLDPEFWKRELDLVESYGFNLMKFCLWVPPKEYLRLADERGILVWMEYPTWHSKWSKDQLATLQTEFDEFFRYDRSHPSIALRSLTCETGPSADLEVIRALYDACHARIPGSIVEDDSSWIQWNRVHDFYDDHPYGNNHTWVATLDRLKGYIAERDSKPLVLGEAIAADTWLNPNSLSSSSDQDRPFWFPGFLDANRAWLEQRSMDMGEASVRRLERDSLDYGLRMRKYQIETYRREVPMGGYVVSVIRDFPLAGMGLLDFQGQPKWLAKDWEWHGPTTLILKTENDRRSFVADSPIEGQILLSHFGQEPVEGGTLRLTVFHHTEGAPPKRVRIAAREHSLRASVRSGTQSLDAFSFPTSDWLKGTPNAPNHVVLRAEWIHGDQSLATNEWDLWIVPPPHPPTHAIALHASCSEETKSLFRDYPLDPESDLIIAQRMDEALLARLESGANVFFLPDGSANSFPTKAHWFLRGGPIVSSLPSWGMLHDLIVQTQHFDLASDVVPDLNWLDQMTPLLLLWDNHDIRDVRSHGLLFGSQVGKGSLLVGSLRFHGETNSVGRYLLARCIDSLKHPNAPDSLLPRDGLKPILATTVQSMRDKLRERSISLTDAEWRFQPDTDNEGLQRGWHEATYPVDGSWKPIRVGAHWESQGYAGLDGWAWYVRDVELPEDWPSGISYFCIEGGDDYYELYINGERIGSAGDLATKKTAFEESRSYPVHVQPGIRRFRIAIRIQDWQGAGGLFRPIRWSTRPNEPRVDILR